MRLDASREFELFTKIVTQIKMHANMINDTDVLISLMETLVTLVVSMYATLPQDIDKEVLRVLLEQKYDEILDANRLKRITA